jgi:hypothetical protein
MEMPEALAKTGTPVAAPPHPPKVIGRRQHKKNIEQNVIKCAHSKSRSFTASLSRNQPPDAKKIFKPATFSMAKENQPASRQNWQRDEWREIENEHGKAAAGEAGSNINDPDLPAPGRWTAGSPGWRESNLLVPRRLICSIAAHDATVRRAAACPAPTFPAALDLVVPGAGAGAGRRRPASAAEFPARTR